MLPVNELFETVQGEATWTGTPAVFLRLQGCGVGCPWCDTKHTWNLEPEHEVTLTALLAKERDGRSWAQAGVETLMAHLDRFQARHVVITGGEPCLYDLTDLTRAIKTGHKRRTVQIETSGTEPVRVYSGAWVTVSPKIAMPGGKVILREAVHRAQEIKFPVGKPADVDALKAFLAEFEPIGQVWLQPLSQSVKATQLCIEAATENGWRVSIQTHKFLGVR